MLKHRAWIASGFFLIMLWLPLVAGMLVPQTDDISALENRALATWPSSASLIEDWPAYSGQVEAWMEDHLGLRAWLIRRYKATRSALDLTSDKRAVYGDEGWLFANIDGVMAMHQGLRAFEAGETEDWLAAAQMLQQKAAARGAEFAVLIGPNKHEVYSEYLRDYPVLLNTPRRAEQLSALAGQAGIPLVYPIEAMLEAKQDEQVYFKTDTHWTGSGAYVAYRALMAKLDALGVGAPTVQRDALTYIETKNRQGDIYGLLGLEDQEGEAVRALAVPASAAREEIELEAFTWSAFPATERRLEVPDPARAGLSVLVLGDSYFYGLAPFLEESFETVTFAHHRGLNPPVEILETGDYDIVVLLLVERALINPLRIEGE